MVIAPTWQVEDFSSFLFVTKLLHEMRSGAHPAEALSTAARHVRELTANKALEEISHIQSTLDKGTWKLNPDVATDLQLRLKEYERWLSRDLEPNEYPFDALDWAGFQVYGYFTKKE
jgi:CHAT domain-containing protein